MEQSSHHLRAFVKSRTKATPYHMLPSFNMWGRCFVIGLILLTGLFSLQFKLHHLWLKRCSLLQSYQALCSCLALPCLMIFFSPLWHCSPWKSSEIFSFILAIKLILRCLFWYKCIHILLGGGGGRERILLLSAETRLGILFYLTRNIDILKKSASIFPTHISPFSMQKAECTSERIRVVVVWSSTRDSICFWAIVTN